MAYGLWFMDYGLWGLQVLRRVLLDAVVVRLSQFGLNG